MFHLFAGKPQNIHPKKIGSVQPMLQLTQYVVLRQSRSALWGRKHACGTCGRTGGHRKLIQHCLLGRKQTPAADWNPWKPFKLHTIYMGYGDMGGCFSLWVPHFKLIPQPGLPEGVLTFSNKECLQLARPSGSPVTARAVPPAPGAGFPQP